MTTRVKQLEEVVATYDELLKHKLSPETKAHFAAKRAESLAELEGERGAAGLNPKTGKEK